MSTGSDLPASAGSAVRAGWLRLKSAVPRARFGPTAEARIRGVLRRPFSLSQLWVVSTPDDHGVTLADAAGDVAAQGVPALDVDPEGAGVDELLLPGVVATGGGGHAEVCDGSVLEPDAAG